MVGGPDWARLAALITRPDAPHILLVGGAGVGKSCAVRRILPEGRISLWLRCARDTNLRVHRDRIRAIAQRSSPDDTLNWIILERAELLHADAQAFLRRILETTTTSTRFLFEVRDSGAVAEPILSRTVLFVIQDRLPFELRGELMHCSKGAVGPDEATEIAEQSDGNIRWAVTQALPEGLAVPGATGLVAPEVLAPGLSLLQRLEATLVTGSSPRAVAERLTGVEQSSDVWERPGGACPFLTLALALALTPTLMSHV